MSKQHSFNQSIKVGKEGEEMVISYIKSLFYISDVQDVSNDSEYQDSDIDLIAYSTKNNNYLTIEIKTDTYDTGNIFFETMSNIEAKVQGCMYKTKADFLFYYFTTTHELYILNMPEYRKWFANNCKYFRKKDFENINKYYDGIYHSCGYLIPKKYLENNFTLYKKYII